MVAPLPILASCFGVLVHLTAPVNNLRLPASDFACGVFFQRLIPEPPKLDPEAARAVGKGFCNQPFHVISRKS